MVLEYLLGYEMNKPLQLFGTGVFFSSIAVFVSAALFAHSPSMVVVTFMTLPMVYIWTSLIGKRSVHEASGDTFRHLWTDNIGIAEDFLVLFLGMTVGVAIWFSVLPEEMLSNLFSEQLWNLNSIGVATGFATTAMATTSSAIRPDVFLVIAANNLKLVLLSALLSFVFAAGALFILAWNASVVGVAVGTIINKLRVAGAIAPIALGQGLGLGVIFYILHLVPEVVAYFYASVAGAFISSALLKYKPMTRQSNRLLVISAAMLAISVGMIMIGALIEVGISHQLQATLHI
ncbi:MAG: hypothetical protein V1887_02570 [Candidatus Aenigmatarchaeota archaeon]